MTTPRSLDLAIMGNGRLIPTWIFIALKTCQVETLVVTIRPGGASITHVSEDHLELGANKQLKVDSWRENLMRKEYLKKLIREFLDFRYELSSHGSNPLQAASRRSIPRIKTLEFDLQSPLAEFDRSVLDFNHLEAVDDVYFTHGTG
jgi:hypothetical protein